MKKHCIVVGGGIQGAFAALLLRRYCELEVTVLMPARDAGQFPPMDTMRNHSWLQYGTLYPNLDKPVARKMSWSGLQMHEAVGLPLPTSRGVFRIDPENESELLNHMAALGLGTQVYRLVDHEARRLLCDFYVEGALYYSVPDTAFDEAGVLNTARAIAREEGVSFRQATVLSLIEDPSSEAGVALVTAEGNIRADYVVICAGAGIPGLLESIRAPHPLRVYQSCLLTIKNNKYLRASLFVDRTCHVSLVRHSVIPRALPAGAIVAGGAGRRLITDVSSIRRVYLPEKEAIATLLPASMYAAARFSNAIAGYKTEATDKDGKSSVAPYVQAIPGLERVIYAVPGKATFAYWAAETIVRLVRQSLSKKNVLPGIRANASPGNIDLLPDSIFVYEMHHMLDFDETVIPDAKDKKK